MSHASVCEGHDRQRQSKIGGSDSEASSRFQEEQAVACSLSSVCTLGSAMGGDGVWEVLDVRVPRALGAHAKPWLFLGVRQKLLESSGQRSD